MHIETAKMIAARLVVLRLAGEYKPDTYGCGNGYVGEFSLRLIREAFMKKAFRFDGLRPEMGRWAQDIRVPQKELHEFLIEYVLPYAIAEGLAATGHIDFKWSGDTNTQ